MWHRCSPSFKRMAACVSLGHKKACQTVGRHSQHTLASALTYTSDKITVILQLLYSDFDASVR